VFSECKGFLETVIDKNELKVLELQAKVGEHFLDTG
jgi:hypothetical protein